MPNHSKKHPCPKLQTLIGWTSTNEFLSGAEKRDLHWFPWNDVPSYGRQFCTNAILGITISRVGQWSHKQAFWKENLQSNQVLHTWIKCGFQQLHLSTVRRWGLVVEGLPSIDLLPVNLWHGPMTNQINLEDRMTESIRKVNNTWLDNLCQPSMYTQDYY